MSSCNERSTRPVWWLLAIVYVLLVHCLAANITFSSVFHLSFCFCLNSNAAPLPPHLPYTHAQTRTHTRAHTLQVCSPRVDYKHPPRCMDVVACSLVHPRIANTRTSAPPAVKDTPCSCHCRKVAEEIRATRHSTRVACF